MEDQKKNEYEHCSSVLEPALWPESRQLGSNPRHRCHGAAQSLAPWCTEIPGSGVKELAKACKDLLYLLTLLKYGENKLLGIKG